MAHIESQALAGYYPFPSSLVSSLASSLTWPDQFSSNPFVVLDPCAADGAAVRSLVDHWSTKKARFTFSAIEMERSRAETLAATHGYPHTTICADAFQVSWRGAGAAALFLNPPYDTDPEYGRLEARWLDRFTDALAPSGVLLYIVPLRWLAASASILAANYSHISCWRFPDTHFEAFGQCIVIGRRQPGAVHDPAIEALVKGWVEKPNTAPTLPERFTEPLHTMPRDYFSLDLTVEQLDVVGLSRTWQPWAGSKVTGAHQSLDDLMRRQYPVAMPPRAAHIALAVAGGQFNGLRLDPNLDRSDLPPILLKGNMQRALTEITTTEKDSHQQSSTCLERPSLNLVALRLDTSTFVEPTPGSEPTGATLLEDFNAADLLSAYSASLGQHMATQFPALHDPSRDEPFPFPTNLPRKPYRAQASAIHTALKLIANGENAPFICEVGTGKTTMALSVLALLSPDQHAETIRSVPGLPVVRRTLVLCPPHLLDTWEEEAAAVVPNFRVVVVRTLSDLSREGEIYVLSRETAKLGHAFQGMEHGTPCPRCGVPVVKEAATNATRRNRCEATPPRPSNDFAHLAERLGALLLPLVPTDPAARALVSRHAVLRRRAKRPAALQLTPSALHDLEQLLFQYIEQVPTAENQGYEVVRNLRTLLLALASRHATEEAIERLSRSADRTDRPSYGYSDSNGAKAIAKALRDAEEAPGYSDALRAAIALGLWTKASPAPTLSRVRNPNGSGHRCGEPMFTAAASPRRYPIATFISRHMPDHFDLVILDEVHEASNRGTAQQKAAHRLIRSRRPTITLTGSPMSGYASSLFDNLWQLDRSFRSAFPDRTADRRRFIDTYGFAKVRFERRDGAPQAIDFGSLSDRERHCTSRRLAEAPGVMPLFLLHHLLPTAIIVHKADLDVQLPSMREHRVPISGGGDPLDGEFTSTYQVLSSQLFDVIAKDRFGPLHGKLWGAAGQLPSYLDRATSLDRDFVLSYPDNAGGGIVASAPAFPQSYRTPKERWLLRTLRDLKAQGRKVIIFVQHTGDARLPKRLLSLAGSQGCRAAWLDVKKVPTKRRKDWIDRHVLGKDIELLIVNPNAVRTGLNNLTSFSAGIWYEPDYDARTYRQANGRLHRIGQTRSVDIYYPYFADTAQETAVELVARKVSASVQVDGLDVTGALELAGGGGTDTSTDLALSIGEAIWRAGTVN